MALNAHRSCVLFLVAFLAGGLGGCMPGEELPDPSSSAYQEVVSDFYTGVIAIQVGENGLAEAALTQVTETVPQEPAAWANLGVLALRRNAFDLAAERLEQARALAPQNAQIYYLLGVLERARGRFEEATGHLRQAVALDSLHLKALYTLTQMMEQQGKLAEAQHMTEAILEAQPSNLAALLERARFAARRGDRQVLHETLARLSERADAWPPPARERLAALQEAAAASDLQRAATEVAFLKNVLKRVPAYRQSLRALRPPAGQQGTLITHFMRLSTPDPRPAPMDDSLTFTAEPLFADAETWAWVGAMFLSGKRNPLTVQQLPSVVVADGHRVRVDTGATFSFPGGPSTTPPAPDGLAALDYNYDFRRDLALAGAGGLRLYQQKENGTFTDVTGTMDLPPAVKEAAYIGVWAADLDMEGDADLVLGPAEGPPVVLRNDGDGTFTEWPLFESVSAPRAFTWADLDADGDPDAALLGRAGTLHVFANQRGGRFKPYPLPPEVNHAVALDVADANSDGLIDLLVLQESGAIQRLSHRRSGQNEWRVAPLAQWPAASNTPTAQNTRLFVADLDNNGGPDLIASTAKSAQVWLSDTTGRFHPRVALPDTRVFSVADLEGDGRLDLVGLSTDGYAVRLVSQGATAYQSKSIRPRAARTRGDRRINPFGLGGEIDLRAGLLYQKQPITEPVVHFGLGTHTEVDVARIIWPNGTKQAEFDLSSNQVVLARQRLKGSCPWVFTYDGEKMHFVTDFLWRTALGLRINLQSASAVLHSIDWIKITGDELAPRNGYYDVRITAELWESHFFDHVALMVVDHPAETRVSIDERFTLPPPEWAVHAMAPLRPVARAFDAEGRDVTETIRKLDGHYLGTFEVGPYQGLAEEHYVEIRLGEDVPPSDSLWLVASGWIRPTDTSINIAISQSHRTPPYGLVLEVPDGRGGWTVAAENLGFPSGKNKTILIDLSEYLRPGTPRRVRLRTNMEIYWDRIAWSVGRPSAPLKTQRLLPHTAELRYRGFSKVTQASHSAPELPHYNQLASTQPVWRDLIGYYTRFGDVRPLLTKIDDRYVIMNAGDELALRFKAPPPPPDGWTRDFILIGDGWVKDGDYNTVLSKTVRPLPYHGLHKYTPAQMTKQLEQDPAYQKHPADWRRYHTRYVTPRRFYRALTVE